MTLLAEVLSEYFSSGLTLTTLGLLLFSFAALFLMFRRARDRPDARLRILFSSFVAAVFAWSSLESALLKISSALPATQSGTEGLAILGRAEAFNPPSVRERVERLIRLDAELRRA